MQKLLQIRGRIGAYGEWYYIFFVLIMGGMVSFGLTSEDLPYVILFIIATCLWGLKVVTTDYNTREFFWIAAIGILLLLNFLGNREKTLLIAYMGIIGAKDVNLEKVMKYTLWVKIALTVLRVSLALLGVVENKVVVIPKDWVYLEMPGYGYIHPNVLYANVVMIAFLAAIVYREKMRWYLWIAITVGMYEAYKILLCRTGFIVWIIFCLLLFGHWVAAKIKLEKVYLHLCVLAPIASAVLTFALSIVGIYHNEPESPFFYLNLFLTGRLQYIANYLPNMGLLILGHRPRESFDSLYFHLCYNYGWILFLTSMVAYCATMWYYQKKRRFYEVIVFAAVAIYGLMEFMPLSAAWNVPLLLISRVLFMRTENEKLQ